MGYEQRAIDVPVVGYVVWPAPVGAFNLTLHLDAGCSSLRAKQRQREGLRKVHLRMLRTRATKLRCWAPFRRVRRDVQVFGQTDLERAWPADRWAWKGCVQCAVARLYGLALLQAVTEPAVPA